MPTYKAKPCSLNLLTEIAIFLVEDTSYVSICTYVCTYVDVSSVCFS